FFVLIGLVSAMGTALVYWVGGHLYLTNPQTFTIGTIVAFGTYLTQLYGPLQALTNAPVDFATSMVSFERVFEIIDKPIEITEKADAVVLPNVRGDVTFEGVTFYYDARNNPILTDVERYDEESIGAVLSGENG
ncbi:MAG TPA: hypothetical protein PLZ51_10710, partial [Aggregatilineales bacterium]|nr:hypothetical protein [Aggregatilineales bacterium]